MLSIALVVGIIALTLFLAVRRLADVRGLGSWVWVALFVSSLLPIAQAWMVLNPGEPTETVELHALHDPVALRVPPGHVLVVEAELGDEDVREAGVGHYAFGLRGPGWEQKAVVEVRRKIGGRTSDGAMTGEQSIGGGARRGAVGEDLAQRIVLEGSGDVTGEVTLWKGGAAEALLVSVVPGGLPQRTLWGIAGLLAVIGLIAEVRGRAVQAAGDIAFFGFFAAMLGGDVTASDGLPDIARAGAVSGLMGWLVIGGAAWILMKIQDLIAAKAESRGTGGGS